MNITCVYNLFVKKYYYNLTQFKQIGNGFLKVLLNFLTELQY